MPGWLQAFVKVNPLTFLTEAERGLLVGGPAATPVMRTLLWSLGLFLVFAPLAVAVYRRALTDRRPALGGGVGVGGGGGGGGEGAGFEIGGNRGGEAG